MSRYIDFPAMEGLRIGAPVWVIEHDLPVLRWWGGYVHDGFKLGLEPTCANFEWKQGRYIFESRLLALRQLQDWAHDRQVAGQQELDRLEPLLLDEAAKPTPNESPERMLLREFMAGVEQLEHHEGLGFNELATARNKAARLFGLPDDYKIS